MDDEDDYSLMLAADTLEQMSNVATSTVPNPPIPPSLTLLKDKQPVDLLTPECKKNEPFFTVPADYKKCKKHNVAAEGQLDNYHSHLIKKCLVDTAEELLPLKDGNSTSNQEHHRKVSTSILLKDNVQKKLDADTDLIRLKHSLAGKKEKLRKLKLVKCHQQKVGSIN